MAFPWVLVLWRGTDLTKELNSLNVYKHCEDSSCGLNSLVFNTSNQGSLWECDSANASGRESTVVGRDL